MVSKQSTSGEPYTGPRQGYTYMKVGNRPGDPAARYYKNIIPSSEDDLEILSGERKRKRRGKFTKRKRKRGKKMSVIKCPKWRKLFGHLARHREKTGHCCTVGFVLDKIFNTGFLRVP